MLQDLLSELADAAAREVDASDRAEVDNAVASYPEGGDFITVTPSEDGYDIGIPSRAAAFFIAGTKAVVETPNRHVARWCFLEAAKRNTSQPAFLNNAAFVLLEFDMFEEAREILQHVKRIAPGHTSAYINMGVALNGLGDYEGAAENFLQAFEQSGQLDHLRMAANSATRAGTSSRVTDAVHELADQLLPDEGGGEGEDEGGGAGAGTPGTRGGKCEPPFPVVRCEQPVGEASVDRRFYDGPWEEKADANQRHHERIGRIYDDYTDRMMDIANNEWVPCSEAASAELRSCNSRCDTSACTHYCRCVNRIATARCKVKSDKALREAAQTREQRVSDEIGLYRGELQAILTRAQKEYPSEFLAYLGCTMDYDMQGFYREEYLCQQRGAVWWVGVTTRNLNQAEEQLAAALAACADARPPVRWMIDSETSVSVGSDFCFLVLCVGIDDSGSISLSIKAGLAVQVSYDPFADEWALSAGLGVQVGAGSAQVDASVMVTFTDGQVTLEPQLGMGSVTVSQVMSFHSYSGMPSP
jgi:tetratricopeptide (TPR) repeat protein